MAGASLILADNPPSLWIIGAGGHAKVVIATCLSAGLTPRGLFDDDVTRVNQRVLGIEVVGPLSEIGSLRVRQHSFIIAVGENASRKEIAARFRGLLWRTVVHPGAIVHPTAKVGEGTVIFAGAVVQPDAQIGVHAIINTGACIDHDSRIGDFCHVGPGCALAGNVALKEGAFLGVGCAVIPGRTIGAWTRVGAGGVVVSDLPSCVTALGIPAAPRSA